MGNLRINPGACCSVCGQEIAHLRGCEISKQKGKNGRTVYAHTDCLKRKGGDRRDTAGERSGG